MGYLWIVLYFISLKLWVAKWIPSHLPTLGYSCAYFRLPIFTLARLLLLAYLLVFLLLARLLVFPFA